ncbi:MAG: hypothetical protein IKB98_09505 [Clostridia bacterium]|nr:hypothetical protein [Clostridia bacterium]
MKSYNACGISVLNPVDVEKDYLNFTVDYAIKLGFNHFQLIGPIHNNVRGNVDGMVYYKKYSQFNNEKDSEYVDYNLEVVNPALEKLHNAGVKSYMWHHELELPVAFTEAFPEVLNSDGDVEVSHPLVKDFLENKIKDFFDEYPLMDGIILTLHETRIPLLKLKNQKLGKVERVKYVTKILYDTCKSLGKELICRPFASIEEDYVMMTKAYEEISTDMVIMDKWTQFDWSLTLPDNKFFAKIKNNPILVETDIFGEYFGKGRFPLMLKEHIEHKVEYCDTFSPIGFCSRIDRAGRHPFGDVNEVNLVIMNACVRGMDVNTAIDNFFESEYPNCGKQVREIMENTEDILKKIIYLKGYYFSELSLFPSINHSKNHFYFEMMKDSFELCSGEWFIPPQWERGSLQSVFEEKDQAMAMADQNYQKLCALKGKLDQEKYDKLHVKFLNLKLCAQAWRILTDVFYNYAKFFEYDDASKEAELYKSLDKLCEIRDLGIQQLGGNFYCSQGDSILVTSTGKSDFISRLVEQIKESFPVEKATFEQLKKQDLLDYVICGGGSEGHKIKKEVNFSDTKVENGRLFRVPGSLRQGFSSVNAHGWFSYEIKVKPNALNQISVVCGSLSPELNLKVTIDEKQTIIKEKDCQVKEITIPYQADKNDCVRIRFDRITGLVPVVYQIKVKA